MNDMSVKIEQLLKLQKGVCEQYEKENKELLKTNFVVSTGLPYAPRL